MNRDNPVTRATSSLPVPDSPMTRVAMLAILSQMERR
jgi:hypothetical protein